MAIGALSYSELHPGICLGDSTRAACFRRWTSSPVSEARMQDARAANGNRRGWVCEKRGKREEVRLDLSTATETLPPTQFTLSRMTSPGFLIVIFEPDTYPPRNMAHPGRPVSLVYHETALPIFSRLCPSSHFRMRPDPNVESSKLFWNIRRRTHRYVLEGRETVLPLPLRFSGSLSHFLPPPRSIRSMLIHSELHSSRFVRSFRER